MKREKNIPLQFKLALGLVAMATALAVVMAPLVAVMFRSRMEIDQQILQCLGFMLCLLLVVLVISVRAYYCYVRRILIRPLDKLHNAVAELVGGRVTSLADFRLEIHTGDELEELADSFQYMVTGLSGYIKNLNQVTAEKERIRAELDVARNIQKSELPTAFPAFPERSEFDIYASMTPAKEVGGDFYDFFLIDDDHLALVMADVSGKGVPAALFMMVTKTLLKAAVQNGLSPRDVLEKVNNQLCENNNERMFVTVWLGILEISTGKMKCANAGHEYPAIRRRNGKFELFRDRHGFVLAGMENGSYDEYELMLQAGDRLVVYTDGVTEAVNNANELYGNARMLRALNAAGDVPCLQLLQFLQKDVEGFAEGVDQFDDITMLAVEIKEQEGKEIKEPVSKEFGIEKTKRKENVGKKSTDSRRELRLTAKNEELSTATNFLEVFLREEKAPERLIFQVDVCIDEVFSNIVRFSNATEVILECEKRENQLILRFSDNGGAYDPTKAPDPDVTLPAEERDIGGLGIFVVKSLMDEMSYEYRDGRNILTLTKNSV